MKRKILFKRVMLSKVYKGGDIQDGILERELNGNKKITRDGRLYTLEDGACVFVPTDQSSTNKYQDTFMLDNGINSYGVSTGISHIRYFSRGCNGFKSFANGDSVYYMSPSDSNNSVFFIPTGRKKSVFDKKFMDNNIIEKTDTIGVGAELELECPDEIRDAWASRGTSNSDMSNELRKLSKLALIQDIGSDGSVRGWGPEIRFAHPDIKGWGLDRIQRVIGTMRRLGFVAGPSAGQHVHISHPKIQIAIAKSVFGIDDMNTFLTPISCRTTTRYGLGRDILRDQFNEFGTLEIRCWESTTNPDLFRKRLLFSKMLVKALLRSGVTYKNIWTKMSKQMQRLYVDMLFTENGHKYGLTTKACLTKMGKYAKAYACVKYNFE